MRINFEEYYAENSKYRRRFGPVLTINGKDAFETFDADLIDYPMVTSPDITKDVYKKVGKHSFMINSVQRGIGGLVLELYVGGRTKDEAQDNYAQLIFELDRGLAVMKINDPVPWNWKESINNPYPNGYDGPSDFEYLCTLSEFEIENMDVQNYFKVTLTVIAIKRKHLLQGEAASGEITNGEMTIDCSGNVRCGIRLIVKTASSLGQDTGFTIGISGQRDINVYDIDTSTFYILDGLEGRVLIGLTEPKVDQDWGSVDNYANYFNHTDLIKFPFILPRGNTIVFSGPIERVIYEYYPVYLM